MTTAPASMQIAINRLLRSLCIMKGPPLIETASPTDKCSFYPITRMRTSEPARARSRPKHSSGKLSWLTLRFRTIQVCPKDLAGPFVIPWKPWRLAGGYAQSVQQALSARCGGGLAAAWARGVQAGSAGEPGELLEGLRHARPERAKIRAFRRRQGDDGRAARARDRAYQGTPSQAGSGRECQGD